MINPLLAPELLELLKNGETEEIKSFFEAMNPAVAAEFLGALETEDLRDILLLCSHDLQAEIFSFIDFDKQRELLRCFKRREISRILTDMPPDDRADLFKRLPEEERESILPALAHAEREDIRRLSSYEEGTAGAAMTSDYATLSPDFTVGEALEHLRVEAPDKETIYYSYVVDRQRRLLGSVSLQDLIVAKRHEKVADIMYTDTIYAYVDDDQEDVVRKIQRFDLFSIPIVNSDGVMIGIITHDDAMDIITEEQTEDIEKLMAIAGSHETGVYMRTSALKHFGNRSVWVAALAILGLFSGMIIQRYEDILAQLTILAVFIPMLAAAGGNTGSQSATLVIRALALKEITFRDIFPVLSKEFRVAILLGLLLGAIAYLRVIIFGGSSSMPDNISLALIGITVAAALSLQVVTATLIGAILPFIATRLKFDPAVIASPALASIVDITGLAIYFATAVFFLGL
jgi:magnesium transporter